MESINAEDEKWAPINIEQSTYEVSDMGRIRNSKMRIMKPATSHGYYQITLRSGLEKSRHFQVHRLVAMAFIPNPKKLPFVNHKDGNKKNNRVENLEWVTQSENTIHSSHVLGKTRKTRPVLQCDKNGVLIMRFESPKLASESTGISIHRIRGNCSGKYISTNFMWKWETETNHNIDLNIFADVPGFNQYMVSRDGSIYSKAQRKLMNPTTDGEGYKKVIFRKDGKDVRFGVHQIVAMTYIPNPFNLPVVNHKDHNKGNNNADNLEYTTVSGNANAAVIAGRIKTTPVHYWGNILQFKKHVVRMKNQMRLEYANRVKLLV
jgi:HNH endonuclease/NUMOD4 motif